MIEVRLDVIITAENDAEADEVIAVLNREHRDWPRTPVVSVWERSRELVREKP